MNKPIGPGKNKCISTYTSTCEKSIYETNKIKLDTEVESVITHSYNQQILLNDSFSAREINLENILIQNNKKLEQSRVFKKLFSGNLTPIDYLRLIETHIPNELISTKNFTEIKNLAFNLNDHLTSFFGFETRLIDSNARSDYLIAVSALKGEREALLNFIESGSLSEKLLDIPEWRQLYDFALNWADPKSDIYDKVLGLWLEFDTANSLDEVLIPSIFLQTIPIRIDSSKDIEKCKWVTDEAIPQLQGRSVPKRVETFFLKILKKLPKGASVFHIASMLSRKTDGIRVIVKNINPDHIVSYLKSIGWNDKDGGLLKLLRELKNFVNCIRLHINVSDHIDQKIGLECFISPDKYNEAFGWKNFFDYLVEKELCDPELEPFVLGFPGVEQENPEYDFNLYSYMPSVKLPDSGFSKAIVRYISHVKITYEPDKSTEAKVYTGIRLFGRLDNSIC